MPNLPPFTDAESVWRSITSSEELTYDPMYQPTMDSMYHNALNLERKKVLLELVRIAHNDVSTLGFLKIDGTFVGFTLEDPPQPEKIPGRTRIPAGKYELEYRFSQKWQESKIYLRDVPNFQGIAIHPGNTALDTEGCLLVGRDAFWEDDSSFTIGKSRPAIKRLYDIVVPAIQTTGAEIVIKDET